MIDMNKLLYALPNIARWAADAATVLQSLLRIEPALCERALAFLSVSFKYKWGWAQLTASNEINKPGKFCMLQTGLRKDEGPQRRTGYLESLGKIPVGWANSPSSGLKQSQHQSRMPPICTLHPIPPCLLSLPGPRRQAGYSPTLAAITSLWH